MRDLSDLEVAIEASRAAGQELLARFRRPLSGLRLKSPYAEDVVTEADEVAESAARAVIARHRPGDAVVGEELGGEAAWRHWSLDPLDGSVYFIRGLGSWAVSLALFEGEANRVSVVFDALGGELWATSGQGITLNGAPVGRPEAPSLECAHLACAVSMLRDRDDVAVARLMQALRRVERFRDFGSPARALAQVAAGRIDFAYYDTPRLHEWDVAAGMGLCQAQGLEVRCLGPWAGEHHRWLVGPRLLLDAFELLLP
jgi:myo-inositol-1(or 4)-monophosphatase